MVFDPAAFRNTRSSLATVPELCDNASPVGTGAELLVETRGADGVVCDQGKLKILFLCTGNACRSQMAEGWARHLKPDRIEAYSAGIAPIGLDSRAVRVMAEADVDISDQHSKHLETFRGEDLDYVVTLCDSAHAACPVFPAKCKVIHRGFEDPYFAQGDEEAVLSTFRRVRDEIKRFVAGMPENLAK